VSLARVRVPGALLVALLLGLGCPTTRAPDSPGEAATTSELDGNRRLGRAVVPLHYTLDLEIDPAQEHFSGQAEIRVDVAAGTRTILLHAADLDFSTASVESGGHLQEVATELGANGALALRLARAIEPGPATLRLAYRGPLPETPYGLYRVQDAGRWYAFTQFEPLEARKAFPSFDQPEFKTPFAVTLRVPPGEVALSNSLQIEHHSEPGAEVFVFAETRPLPTYLVAFAVGALEVLESSTAGGGGPPTRLAATAGKAELGRYALARTPLILRWLTDYFDHPYPFAKLDLVAVPNFGAGAMENAGLVTFREPLLLLDPEEAPIWARRSSQSVIAHELAHMWYGNLVTMPWWDDLWLNESFATWMAGKVLADVDPELEAELDAVSYAQYTMRLDSKRDARQVRQPIHDGGDVYNAFDGITYGKGAAVLRMVEAWIGEEAFRTGVRAYMADHAYGSGGTRELLSALEAASGQPVGETMRWFLDQPGTPLVHVELHCGEDTSPTLRLTQTRALPEGSDAPVGEPWSVPVCVAFATGDPSAPRARECFVLEGREQETSLSSAPACPAWIHPNDGERGYYRWSLPADDLVALVETHAGDLEIAERVAIPGHYRALLEAGRLPVDRALRVAVLLAADEARQVVAAAARELEFLGEVAIPDADSALALQFAELVRAALGPQLERVGILPRSGEPAEDRLRRAAVLSVLGELGRDPRVREEAQRVAASFVVDPTSVDEETLGLLLPLAAELGDEVLWSSLVETVADPPSPAVRRIVVGSLGRFGDEALLERSLDLVLDGRLRAQDYRTVVGGVPASRREIAWRWLTRDDGANYRAVVGKLGPMTSTQLPRLARGLCTEADRDRVEAFFASVEGAPSGTDRNVGLVLEDISRCAQLRASIQGPVGAALVTLKRD
jgi:alanyl aminopeptidase